MAQKLRTEVAREVARKLLEVARKWPGSFYANTKRKQKDQKQQKETETKSKTKTSRRSGRNSAPKT